MMSNALTIAGKHVVLNIAFCRIKRHFRFVNCFITNIIFKVYGLSFPQIFVPHWFWHWMVKSPPHRFTTPDIHFPWNLTGDGQKFPHQFTTQDIRSPIQLLPWTIVPPHICCPTFQDLIFKSTIGLPGILNMNKWMTLWHVMALQIRDIRLRPTNTFGPKLKVCTWCE